jgi:peptidyl-prolyl cis-trans isomerase SurA
MIDLPAPKKPEGPSPPAATGGPEKKKAEGASRAVPDPPGLEPAKSPSSLEAPANTGLESPGTAASAGTRAPAGTPAPAGTGPTGSKKATAPAPATTGGSAAKSPESPTKPAGALELEAAPASAPPPASGPAQGGTAKPAAPPASGAGAANGSDVPAAPEAGDKSTAVRKEASDEKLASGLPLESSPALSVASSASASAPAIRRAAARPVAPLRDDQIIRTAGTPDKPAAKDQTHDMKRAGRGVVARVGDEIITFHDLVVATKELMQRYPELRSRDNFDSADQLEKRKQTVFVARQTLEALIERSMLVQEAKRQIKDPKQIDRLMEVADKAWREEELPLMVRGNHVDNEQQLKDKLAEQGRSLDSIRKAFRQIYLAEAFVHEKLKDKTGVELPDLLKYYSEHVHQHEFDQPAQTTWRELVVDMRKYPGRDEALKKANDLHERLFRGFDFAQLAQAESDGAASARKQGGLMHTSPGAYAVASVNLALESLPIGKLSSVLQGPDTLHIVRVEKRRQAGPATFEEVQDKIMPIVVERKRQTERAAFIAKLRKKTLITTIFDGSQYNPNKLAISK